LAGTGVVVAAIAGRIQPVHRQCGLIGIILDQANGYRTIAHSTPCGRISQSTTNVTFKLTRHSVTLPSGAVTALISFTHAPLMLFTDWAAFFRPFSTASSM